MQRQSITWQMLQSTNGRKHKGSGAKDTDSAWPNLEQLPPVDKDRELHRAFLSNQVLQLSSLYMASLINRYMADQETTAMRMKTMVDNQVQKQ